MAERAKSRQKIIDFTRIFREIISTVLYNDVKFKCNHGTPHHGCHPPISTKHRQSSPAQNADPSSMTSLAALQLSHYCVANRELQDTNDFDWSVVSKKDVLFAAAGRKIATQSRCCTFRRGGGASEQGALLPWLFLASKVSIIMTIITRRR